MFRRSKKSCGVQVALLAEGVDRNLKAGEHSMTFPPVALLAEGVDRNYPARTCGSGFHRRPPRGGRG